MGNIEGDWVSYHETGLVKQTQFFLKNNLEGFVKDYNEWGKLNFVQKI